MQSVIFYTGNSYPKMKSFATFILPRVAEIVDVWKRTMWFTLIFIIIRTNRKENHQKNSKTLDIGTRLLDNAAFVRIHVVERFSKNFSEMRGLRS